MQRSLLDFVALMLGVVYSMYPAHPQLTARVVPQWLCVPKQFIMLTATTLSSACVYTVTCWYMTIQPWYEGGTGSSYKVIA